MHILPPSVMSDPECEATVSWAGRIISHVSPNIPATKSYARLVKLLSNGQYDNGAGELVHVEILTAAAKMEQPVLLRQSRLLGRVLAAISVSHCK